MKLSLTIDPGRHTRTNVPLEMMLPEGAPDGGWMLEPGGIPGHSMNRRLLFLLDRIEAGKPTTLTATPATVPDRVQAVESGDTVAFTDGGKPVTTYHFGDRSPLPVPARPYFAPLLLDGLNLSREVAPKAGPRREIDHPHHKSLWVAFGNVNGTDCWDDADHRGFIRHRAFPYVSSGPACAAFGESLLWTSKAGDPLLDETRTFKLWRAVPGGRYLDLTVLLTAREKPVTFGDTKEGGLCSIRIAEALQGDATGTLTNAHGGTGEPECWGYRSPWIDCSGTLAGRKVGIAIMDHPKGFRFPTHWHARDYGLYTANPFAWHDYQTGWSKDGSHVLAPGTTIPFHYRVFLHEGDAATAGVAARWLDFAHPPTAEVKPD